MVEATSASALAQDPAPAPVASGPVSSATGNDFQKEVDKKKAAASGGAPEASGEVKIPGINTLAAAPSGGAPDASGSAPDASGGAPDASGGASGASGGAPGASGGASGASGDASGASGDASGASGGASSASGGASSASGGASSASGGASSASGGASSASGGASGASGDASSASGDASGASGGASGASGDASSASGDASGASGDASSASGNAPDASGNAPDASGGAAGAKSDAEKIVENMPKDPLDSELGSGVLDRAIQYSIDLVNSVRGKDGSTIVGRLEDVNYLLFEGEYKNQIRDIYIKAFDSSPFFEKLVLDYFVQRNRVKTTTLSVGELTGAVGTASSGEIKLDDSLFNGSSMSPIHVFVHEMFHIAGIPHGAVMNQAMAVFSAESGMVEKTKVGYSPDLMGNSFDYDLFVATRKDWDSVGASNADKSDAYKQGLETLFGENADTVDANGEFSKSSQSFNGDASSIAKSYLNALDGGEVEKLRAKQLENLGIDPQSLKGTDGHLNYLVSYYHEYISIPNRTAPSLTDEAQGMFENMLQRYFLVEDPKGSNDDAVKWVLNQINGRLPGVYPDGEANTYWDERDDGVEATGILWNYYTKHSGGEPLRNLAQSVRDRLGMDPEVIPYRR